MIARRRPRVRMPNPSLDIVPEAGGQDGWVWAVPLPYQALAAPWSTAPMPASPRDVGEHEGRFEHQLGYYSCLLSFLTYSFGWTRPDKGLLWWYSNGMPTDDDRLALITDTWHADGTLIGFLAWLASRPSLDAAPDTLGPFAKHLDESPLQLDGTWELQLREALALEPWSGGGDPLHLGSGWHISAPSRGRTPRQASSEAASKRSSRIVGVDAASRTATFVSDTIEGWYAGLVVAGERLPSRADGRSWRVDVFVKSIGFLGTYRMSRVTGLWFSGQHRYHSVGN